MAWYQEIIEEHPYIYEMAHELAWEFAESVYPLERSYEFEEGEIYVSGWASVDCCGDIIPVPDDGHSRNNKLVLSGKILDEMAIASGFQKGDWFWRNLLENWQDFNTEFTIRIRGCVIECDYKEYVSSSSKKYSSDIQDWIDYIKDRYLYGNDELIDEFDQWLSEENNYKRLVDFLRSFDEYFYKLGDRLVEYIKNFVSYYNKSFKFYLTDLAARKVAENLADSYQLSFVKACSQFYKDGDTIPGAVFVVVRDEVWEEFLASELGTEIAEDDYEALDTIRDHFMDILVEFLDYPRDLIDDVGSLFVSGRNISGGGR
jgi:hypothetical protein